MNKFTGWAASLILAVAPLAASHAADASAAVEDVVRAYFAALDQYDYETMRSMVTPRFETLDNGIRITHLEFEDEVRSLAQQKGLQLRPDPRLFNTTVSGDVAYTTFTNTLAGSEFLQAMILRKVGERWLIDRFMHMPVTRSAERVVRQYYHHIKAYNYDAMREAAAPDFEIIYRGLRLSQQQFNDRHREEEQTLGPAWSRPDRFNYQLADFRIDETPNFAFVSFTATNTETTQKQNATVPLFNTKYTNMIVLRRADEASGWQVFRQVSFPQPRDPTAPDIGFTRPADR